MIRKAKILSGPRTGEKIILYRSKISDYEPIDWHEAFKNKLAISLPNLLDDNEYHKAQKIIKAGLGEELEVFSRGAYFYCLVWKENSDIDNIELILGQND